MGFGGQVRSQLYVALLQKVRHPVSFLLELGIPILLMFALTGIKSTADIEREVFTSYEVNASLVPSINDLLDFPTNFSLSGLGGGPGGPGQAPSAWYLSNLAGFAGHGASNIAVVCDTNELQSGARGGPMPSLTSICAPLKFVSIPLNAGDVEQQAAADAFRVWWEAREPLLVSQSRFDLNGASIADNAALESYVSASGYGQPDMPRIGLAVVFESGAPDFRYQIRVNRTAAYSDGPPRRNVPRAGGTAPNTTDLQRGTTDFAQQYIMSGFSTVQQEVDMWAFHNVSGAGGGAGANATTLLRSSSFAMPTEAYELDTFWSSAGSVFGLFLVLSMLYPIAMVINQLTADKETRVRELMEVMGLRIAAYNVAWTGFYLVFFTVLAGVLTGISQINVFTFSAGSVVFVYFLLFLCASVAYSFFIASMFYRANLATVVGLLIYFLGYLLFTPLTAEDSALGAQLVVSLIPSAAFCFGTISLQEFEGGLVGLNWGNVGSGTSPYTMATCMAMLVLDTVLFLLLAWYLDAVLKSPLGAARRKWHFPVTSCCGCFFRRGGSAAAATPYASFVGALEAEEAALVQGSDGRFQAVGEQLRQLRQQGTGIAMSGLCKTYTSAKGPVRAVDELTLSFFEGQITALLGLNGAGKSSTINILSGLVPASAGQAFLGGLSVSEDMAAIRSNLGVCPQQNVLYPSLTVAEHLHVFAGIKGLPPGPDTDAQVAQTIADVGLTPKTNTVSKALSGGMKRKLQLAIALFGGSKYVICDEPTSGLDPYARAFVQQTLSRFREGRTIILSTHYMDEADLLGDRIAIVSRGRLMAVGTSLFLKKRFGVGYQIACDCAAPPAARQPLIELIQRHVPEAKVTSNVGAELMLALPLTASSTFADLLEELEARQDDLQILDTGISVSTLESCFLRVADGDTENQTQEFINSARQEENAAGDAAAIKDAAPAADAAAADAAPEAAAAAAAAAEPKQVGVTVAGELDKVAAEPEAIEYLPPSTSRHTKALFLKRVRYAKRDKGAFCCQICVPVIFLVLGFVAMAVSVRSEVPALWFDSSTDGWNVEPPLDNPVPFNVGKGGSAPAAAPNATADVMGLFELPRVDRSQAFNGIGPTGPYCATPAYIQTVVRALVSLLPVVLPGLLPPGFDEDDADAIDPEFVAPLLGLTLCDSSTAFSNSTKAFSSSLADTRSVSPGSRYGSVLFDVLSDPAAPVDPAAPLEYTVVYNFTGVHALPLMLNRVNSALLGLYNGGGAAGGPTISTATHPLPRTEAEANISAGFSSFSAALALGIAFSFVPAGFAVFVVREKQNKSLEQQLINGVSPLAYWASSLCFDLLVFCVSFLVAIVLLLAFENSREGFADDGHIWAVLVIFVFFALSVSFFTYCWTFAFSSYRTAQLAMIGINLVGGVILLVVAFLMFLLEDTYEANNVLVYFYRLLPTFCFSHGLLQIAQVDILGLVLNSKERGGDPNNPKEYTIWSWDIAGADIFFLAAEIFLYAGLLWYLQRRFPDGNCECSAVKRRMCCCRRARIANGAQSDEESVATAADATATAAATAASTAAAAATAAFAVLEDSDVVAERARVDNVAEAVAAAGGSGADLESSGQLPDGADDALVLRAVRKVFPPIGGKARPKVAVADMTLGVHKNECFSLLGTNGAGKSTLMAISAGSLPPTAGAVQVNQFDMVSQRAHALQGLGFCPQYDAIFDLLTGREHLELYGAIKGIPPKVLGPLVEQCLQDLALSDYGDRLAGGYSGGNKRKLSMACAVIGRPKLILIDEVAAGVDPASRRFLWEVISRLSKTSSIVLTTHSMEECEALSSRIGIMVDGRLKCLGTAQHLKSRYGTGYQLEVTLKVPTEAQIADTLASMGAVLPGTKLDRAAVSDALTKAGHANLLEECFSRAGSAALLQQQLEHGLGAVESRALADWLVSELAFRGFEHFLIEESPLHDVALVERQSLRLRFAIPLQDKLKLHEIFRIFEGQRDRVEAYSLGQTSMETIFNNFAAQQSKDIN